MARSQIKATKGVQKKQQDMKVGAVLLPTLLTAPAHLKAAGLKLIKKGKALCKLNA